jgi:peroxiredoxin
MLKVGDNAPVFEVPDQNQQPVKLQDFRGKKVLLAFYPFAFSPVCADEFACFRNDLSQFQKMGIEVLGISVDSHWSNKAFADSLGVSYPLLSDFGREVSKAYGVLRPEGFSERAYFLVDENGKLAFAQVMDTPAKRLENEELLKAINNTMEEV